MESVCLVSKMIPLKSALCNVKFSGKTVKSDKKFDNETTELNRGKLLGHSHEGFQPLKTEDSSDSDEFFVPT